jgi:hypothetical protein
MKISTKYKRKAKNAGRQALYQAMWQEEVPVKYRKCGGRLMTPKNQSKGGKGRAPA